MGPVAPCRFLALSLTGSGHLLTYQLGACQTLLENGFPIKHVVGSSGGAIVATLVALLPGRLEAYAREFISARGRGLSLLEDLLSDRPVRVNETSPKLQICVTRCTDGLPHLFSFDTPSVDHERLLLCVKASCMIPPTFHPMDIFSPPSPYPEDQGMDIDGEAYVDGGIASPAPPTPTEFRRVIISPVSGDPPLDDFRISPRDNSWAWLGQLSAEQDFMVRSSWNNLRALRVASGAASSQELQEWHELGQRDAESFLLMFR